MRTLQWLGLSLVIVVAVSTRRRRPTPQRAIVLRRLHPPTRKMNAMATNTTTSE